MLNSLDHRCSLQKIYRFITSLKIEIVLFIKQFLPNFARDNWWKLAKVGANMLSGVVIISILSSDVP